METIQTRLLFLAILLLPIFGNATLSVGVGQASITPPIGTPSAGYPDRNGEGMQGIHDPLLAMALFIDNGEKKIALCSVDHLGFTYDMVQKVIEQVHQTPGLEQCEIFIGSSHTHSGGGAYLDIPLLGETLAGTYSPQLSKFYIDQTSRAIVQASDNLVPAKIGIGYGKAKNLSRYRGLFPPDVTPISDVAVIKVTTQESTPLAALFNFAVHPTVLKSENRRFSADFVGYAREHLQLLLGSSVHAMYINGAQADILPAILDKQNPFNSCELLGQSLAETVKTIWNETTTNEIVKVTLQKKPYTLQPKATPSGLALPLDNYNSEMNIIVFNDTHAFLTIPGELSTIYDRQLKDEGVKLGYEHVSIFGLTNDAHGYIILPESWRHKTKESALSFGGEEYGDFIAQCAQLLLKENAPKK